MQLPEDRIANFLKKHHVFTLATVSGERSWCCTCFYAYRPDDASFVFTSDRNTRHAKEALCQPRVSGSVVLETSVIGKIQGIQLEGILSLPEGEELEKCRVAYLKRFPFAVLMETTLWRLELHTLKMTDNQLGFGKKILWNRVEP